MPLHATFSPTHDVEDPDKIATHGHARLYHAPETQSNRTAFSSQPNDACGSDAPRLRQRPAIYPIPRLTGPGKTWHTVREGERI